jgi:hypothetical protein
VTEIFGDAVAVAAMVDRLVHHAEVIVLKGESYRLKGKRATQGRDQNGGRPRPGRSPGVFRSHHLLAGFLCDH